MGHLPWWERLGVPRSMVADGSTGRRVLVVSHTAFLRRILGDFLEQNGGAIVETRSSVEHALAQPVADLDLVIAEYGMPRESGLALLKAIRTGRSGFPVDVPFVVVVENAERWLVESAVQLDAGGCLLLPISAQKVEEAMKLALRREHAQPPQAYETVDILPPVEVPVVEAVVAAPVMASCFARAMPDAFMVKVTDLVDGMVLGADLVSEHGMVLLVAGTSLDKAATGRLRHAADAFGFEYVPVVERGGRGP